MDEASTGKSATVSTKPIAWPATGLTQIETAQPMAASTTDPHSEPKPLASKSDTPATQTDVAQPEVALEKDSHLEPKPSVSKSDTWPTQADVVVTE